MTWTTAFYHVFKGSSTLYYWAVLFNDQNMDPDYRQAINEAASSYSEFISKSCDEQNVLSWLVSTNVSNYDVRVMRVFNIRFKMFT